MCRQISNLLFTLHHYHLPTSVLCGWSAPGIRHVRKPAPSTPLLVCSLFIYVVHLFRLYSYFHAHLVIFVICYQRWWLHEVSNVGITIVPQWEPSPKSLERLVSRLGLWRRRTDNEARRWWAFVDDAWRLTPVIYQIIITNVVRLIKLWWRWTFY